MIVLRTYSHPHEAHVACAALRAAGIHARLADEHIVAANWLYSNAVGGVKLLVAADDAADAATVLGTEAEVDPAEISLVRNPDACPKCGSHDLAALTPGRRWSFLTWLLAGIPLLPVRRRTKCRSCGHQYATESE